MRRRDFIKVVAGSVATWPLVARAQQVTTPLIGFLSSRSPSESEALVTAFRQGLAETGYVEGQNIHLAFRWAEGRYDRLPELAAELVKSQVAAIASVGGSVSALAAKSATRTIPIVAVTSDPIKAGLVASFNRPGGNITVVSPSSTLLSAKRLGLLRELVPTATLIGVLLNPKLPDSTTQLEDIEEAARTLGEQIRIANASSEQDIDAAFASLSQQGVGALVSGVDPFFDTRRDQIIALAAHYAVPTIYAQPPPPLNMLLSRHTRRRDFIALLGNAVTWPLAARAQQSRQRPLLTQSGHRRSLPILQFEPVRWVGRRDRTCRSRCAMPQAMKLHYESMQRNSLRLPRTCLWPGAAPPQRRR